MTHLNTINFLESNQLAVGKRRPVGLGHLLHIYICLSSVFIVLIQIDVSSIKMVSARYSGGPLFRAGVRSRLLFIVTFRVPAIRVRYRQC